MRARHQLPHSKDRSGAGRSRLHKSYIIAPAPDAAKSFETSDDGKNSSYEVDPMNYQVTFFEKREKMLCFIHLLVHLVATRKEKEC